MAESNPQIERRLRRVGQQLRLLRADLQVTEEQLNQLRDEAYDAGCVRWYLRPLWQSGSIAGSLDMLSV